MKQAEKQEPVAWMCADESLVHKGYSRFSRNCEGDWNIPVYTTRPAAPRQWAGLTDDEIKEIIGPWGETPIKGYTRKLFDQIEAKLKEKNR